MEIGLSWTLMLCFAGGRSVGRSFKAMFFFGVSCGRNVHERVVELVPFPCQVCFPSSLTSLPCSSPSDVDVDVNLVHSALFGTTKKSDHMHNQWSVCAPNPAWRFDWLNVPFVTVHTFPNVLYRRTHGHDNTH